MKAVVLSGFGGPENMRIGDVEKPAIISPHDVLIKVKATGINRTDVLQRKGSYAVPQGASPIMGIEVSGIVENIGNEVRLFKVGDRVMGLSDGGGYAEYVVIKEGQIMKLPENFSWEQGASIPETFLTAFQNIFFIGETKNNSKVLIHAGASGVGVAAIQLCNTRNIDVFVTAGSQEKLEFCKTLGAKGGANYKIGDWKEEIKKQSNGGVNFILDCIGKNYFAANLDLLLDDGRMLIIGTLSGSKITEELDISPILRKRLRIEGSLLRARNYEYKAELTSSLMKFSDGLWGVSLKPVIAQVFDWKNVAEAHKYMEEDKNL